MNLKILTYWPTDHGEIFYSVPNQSAIDNACEQVAHYCRNELAAKYGHWKLAEERLNIALNFLKNTNSGFEYLIFKRIAELCAEEKSMVVIESCSIIDYLMGLTAVNPLKPHYYCPKCHRVEERDDVKDGFDLLQKLCPDCGEAMNRDGHNCSEYLNWKESKRGNFQKRIVGIQFTKRICRRCATIVYIQICISINQMNSNIIQFLSTLTICMI